MTTLLEKPASWVLIIIIIINKVPNLSHSINAICQLGTDVPNSSLQMCQL
jgi:hypothetical protein